jgi:DNA-binding transcriptional regulator YiaG
MKKYKSEIYKVVHQDAKADFEVGAITEERMRYYDEMCFAEEPKKAYKTKQPENIEFAGSPATV